MLLTNPFACSVCSGFHQPPVLFATVLQGTYFCSWDFKFLIFFIIRRTPKICQYPAKNFIDERRQNKKNIQRRRLPLRGEQADNKNRKARNIGIIYFFILRTSLFKSRTMSFPHSLKFYQAKQRRPLHLLSFPHESRAVCPQQYLDAIPARRCPRAEPCN